MADPCAKCKPKRHLAIHQCCTCARAALRRVAKLQRLIVASDRLNSMYDGGVHAEAARIAKRKPAARLARQGKP